jgi:hypothetical protein
MLAPYWEDSCYVTKLFIHEGTTFRNTPLHVALVAAGACEAAADALRAAASDGAQTSILSAITQLAGDEDESGRKFTDEDHRWQNRR